ncbi:hypothetical protein N0V90_008117 [Kalmusia sp. IMI 367209]|nr:hypothetical protein N0V90_008117 [Kalmusia sp. IMI 367209]
MLGFTLKDDAVSLVLDQDVALADTGDLMTITLLSPREDSVRHATEVQVSTEVCLKSQYLGPMIRIAEKDPTNITVGGELKREGPNKYGEKEGEHKEGALVWLAHLHNLSQTRMGELGLHNVSITAVWHAIRMWRYYEKEEDVKALQEWFNKWYDTAIANTQLNLDAARSLALPCQVFDHAVGFARANKYLAYHNIGRIKECHPKGVNIRALHLAPNDFIGPSNHARGGLKTTLHKMIWKKANNILRFDTEKCNCWDATIGQYLAALVQVDAFPIEDVVKRSSINEIVERLKQFQFDYSPTCRRCRSIDFVYVVKMTIQAAENYFDGLCLDCMNRSKPKGKDLDDEYWRINKSSMNHWDTRCRSKHNQSSWYVSWLGRDDTRQKLLKGDSGYREEED